MYDLYNFQVTADLSVDSRCNFNEQENLNIYLCLTEMMVALMILDEGKML